MLTFNKEVNMDKELVRHVFILIIIFFFLSNSCKGYTLTTSSEKATVGLDYTFICVTTEKLLLFNRDNTDICTITDDTTDGTCVFDGDYITEYTYTCNPTTNTYTVTIPGPYLTENLHGTRWRCQDPFGGGISNTKILYVNDPISSATLLSTPTDKNPVEVVSNRDQTFSCKTNAARPSSRIQWYLSTTNITTSASPQPDVCNTDCSDDKVISSSVLTYTGNTNDDGKILYCTAVNIEGMGVVRSSNKTIVIWYGPNEVIITPSTQSYTLNETENLNPIQCTADCIPNCTMTWSGPNLPPGTISVLNLLDINRNQKGNYQCTASNDVSNQTSVEVNVVVQYGPNMVIIKPSTQSYILNEKENLNQINCTADCIPVCTMTWSGPNLHIGTTSLLNLQNVNRNQTGNYQCTASNDFGSNTSVVVNVTVQYEPTSTPSIIQTPPGPINESSTVILTCDIKGGNPLATITWTCEGSFTIVPTTNTATSSVQLTVNSNDNGRLCTCIGHHPFWTTDKTTSLTLDVRYQPTTSITIIQTPVGSINEGNKVTLTCTIQGGNPVATIMWSCDGSTQITPTGSPSTVDAISSVELVTSKNNNGQICTCTGRHLLWTNDKAQQHSIIVYYAPSKIPSIQQIPQGPIMVDTNVTLICTVAHGNPLAMLSWNCTGTTLSSTVGNTTSQSVLLTVNKTNIMCICSAIHPVSSYRPRVEHVMHAYYIDSKADIECNASATVIIRCSLTPQGAQVNPVKWLHHFKNRTIRSLRGDISGSDFTLTLPFCNYQDIGSYFCVWNTSYELVHKLVIVSVSGPPIISDQTVVVKENEVLVSSLFYAVPHPENPIWYAAGNVLPIGKKYRSSTFPTKIMLRLYNEIVDLDGYISTLFIDDFHSIDQGTYTCTIRNPFGSLNVDIDTRETTQSKTDECSSTELSVGVFVGSLVACIIATAVVSTCLQMIICQQIKKSKRLAKDRSNQYQDIAMSTTTNVYDTVNE